MGRLLFASLTSVTSIACIVLISACGKIGSNLAGLNIPFTDKPAAQPAPGTDPDPGIPTDPESPTDNAVVRYQWKIPVQSEDQYNPWSALAAASGNQPISGIVAPHVKFTLSNDNFSTPPASGLASYGSLDITDLYDNKLKSCGPNGNKKCTKAGIRIYTTGTDGSGLWNSDEEYGLPITTGEHVIGLNAANSVVLKSVNITPKTRVLRLSNFTDEDLFQIPISVDFTDAAAGNYSSTLVVEYYLE